MKAVEFSEQTVVFGKNQPQYLPLPAHADKGEEGRVTFCWRLTWRERLTLLVTGRLWHQVLTFRNPLQPQLLLLQKPNFRPPLGEDFSDLKNELGR